jgi:hypothetical protein
VSDHRVDLHRGWTAWRLAALRSAGLPVERLDVFLPDASVPADGDRAARGAAMERRHRAAFDALLADDLFAGALTWQNPEAMDTWAGGPAAAVRAGARPRAGRFGHRLAVLARYAQRYSAKNDTIGFFGPVAWARLGGDRSGWTGAGGLRQRTAYVEVWAVQAIAEAWRHEPRLRPYLPIRLDPACELRDSAVVRPYRGAVELTGEERELLATIAHGAGRRGAVAAAAPQLNVDAVVDRLAAAGVLQVGFRVPIQSHPLDGLAAQIEPIPDPELRAELCARIDGVRQVCLAVGAATAPEQLRTALAAAADALDAAAGAPVRRGAGLAVGGRTPLYLDCRRDLDATIDDVLLADLARPLAVLLDSARWLCGQVADVVEEALLQRYRRLSATRTEVTLSDLHLTAADLLDPAGDSYAEIVADFRLRWQEILDPDQAGATGSRVEIDFDVAAQLADALFPPPRRTWAAAHMHSPDVMVRRRPDGSLGWVLGELHVALNTLESRFFSAQCEDAAELVEAMAADIAPGRVVPLYPRSARDVSSRSYPPLSLDPPGHYRYISFGSDDGHPSGATSSPATALVVTERDGELIATCARDGWAAPVLECLGEHLSSVAVNLFSLRAPAEHLPRVDLGGVTICRETWRLPLTAVTQVRSRDKDPMQDELRSLLAERGIPRHVFARVPGDRKPFHIDLAAPMLADNLARAARRAGLAAGAAETLTLVEMVPGPDELWLRLPDGSFTSELRLVVVDPEPVAPASWRVG